MGKEDDIIVAVARMETKLDIFVEAVKGLNLRQNEIDKKSEENSVKISFLGKHLDSVGTILREHTENVFIHSNTNLLGVFRKSARFIKNWWHVFAAGGVLLRSLWNHLH